MIKEFLITLGVFENLIDECNARTPFDFLQIHKLNPYYWKIKEGMKKQNTEVKI